MPRPRTEKRGRPKNKKCGACALLDIDECKRIHGPEGDNCFDESVCHRRRSYHRNKSKINSDLRRARRKEKFPEPTKPLSPPDTKGIYGAVLILYQEHSDSPVHAIAAEIWEGDKLIQSVGKHSMGMYSPDAVNYIAELLQLINEEYGIRRFEPEVSSRKIEECPYRPCPYHTETA